uniref:Uncharacterized protein n=1 Tax=Prymnesium polylepis TaxID=72548 RepID=A0A6V4LQ44_9EUKA|mmetsp:Transcript_14567/g.36976  ORF Transcript_14567/g.36976 Transcript_14567/m.36976 type:complete len:172 (+) Transcript_14567:101-616(+)
MHFPRPETKDAGSFCRRRRRRREAEGGGDEGETAAGDPQQPARTATGNARQQRSDERLRKFQEAKVCAKYAQCKLGKVLRFILQQQRWQETQRIWTAWMRAETAAPTVEIKMLEAPKPADKQAASSVSQASESQESDDEDTDRNFHHRRVGRAERDRELMPPPPLPAGGEG